MDKSRASAAFALPITGFAVLYAAGSAVTGWEPALGWLIQAIIHVGELLAVVALACSGAGGRVARAGLAVAIAGQVVFVAAEVIWPHAPGLGDTLFGVSPILTGAGLVTAGVPFARASRFLPLVLGAATLLVLIPVMIASGGPPAPGALWTIAGWDLLWSALAASLLLRRTAVAGRAR